MNKTSTDSGYDKRNYFRVSSDVFFDYKQVDSFTAENSDAENEFEDAVSLNLINELRRLDKDNVQTLRLLTEKNRLLGDYLQTLSSKIDLIARHTLFTQDHFSGQKEKTRINISEDGISFTADKALYKGNYLVVRMIFLPSYAPVVTFAKVLRCESAGDKHHIAASFHRIEEKDRQELSRQILKAQVMLKKQSKK